MSAVVLTAGIVAAALLVVAVPVLIGKVISLGDRLDDGALCEAIVDELAQRREVRS